MSLKNFKASGMAIEGMEELVNNLSNVMPREARNLARTTVHQIAGEVRNAMRSRAPKKTGTLRKAIVTKRNRGTPDQISSDVIITKGKGQKNDAWYWGFVEFGTIKQSAQPFIVPAIEEMRSKIADIFREKWVKNLERFMARRSKMSR